MKTINVAKSPVDEIKGVHVMGTVRSATVPRRATPMPAGHRKSI
jgi:hypothetical protein